MLALSLLVLSVQPPVAPPPRLANPFAKWDKNILAIEKRLAEKPPKAGSVFFAGSSSIVKWDLDKSFPELGAVNVGFGGSVIRDSTHFAPRILIPFKPRLIVFYAGDNDIGSGRTAEQVASDFREFCAVIHKDLPACRILFIAVKPSPARWKHFDTQTQANTLVRTFCTTDPRLGYVDIVPPMLGPDGKPIADLFVKDGLHLSPKGYEIWTATVNRTLGK